MTFEKLCVMFSKNSLYSLPNNFYEKIDCIIDTPIFLRENDFNNRADYDYIVSKCTTTTTLFKILTVYFSKTNETLHDSLLNFFKMFTIKANFSILTRNNFSASAISLNLFKKLSPKLNIFDVIPESLECKIRESFIGGRNEIFGNPPSNGDEISYFDFISFYGTIMQENNFPVGSLELL